MNYSREKLLSRVELAVILLLACVPLFVTFPFRVNIFISWEGAYRMSNGELPFKDFGTSLGGMYWVIPALFFKIFGTQMVTLVKAQVFINILSGLAFRSILRSLSVKPEVIFISVCLYCISYSFFNFWPWYNHSVIVYQFIGLAFLFKSFNSGKVRNQLILVALAALFTCFSFLTKQDAGGMAFMGACVLLGYMALTEKNWMQLGCFILAFFLFFFLITLPFYGYGFGYWFNHGQAPHTARISIGEIINEFFNASVWIKFYLFLILMIVIGRVKQWKTWMANRKEMLFLLLTIIILGEAAVFQVTSYTPPDNNIFFHSFAFAFILSALAGANLFSFNKTWSLVLVLAGLMLWWSSTYWKYVQRIVDRAFPPNTEVVTSSGENVVNRNTYMLNKDTTDVPMSEWRYTNLKSFSRIYMPGETVEGIERLMNMDLVKQGKAKKVLNMTELTPLAVEIPYELEKGVHYPLWYHLGVSMFNKEAEMFESKIKANEYDLVLFEYIPALNNFFPFRVRDTLKVNYQMIDSFRAPRRGDTQGVIEVYVRKQEEISL